jgi:ubiquinone/menaquinone biosynthesis C-methylase UbiE
MIRLTLISLLLSSATLACADEKPAPATEPAPPALTEYMGREIAQTMHWSAAGWLVRHKRDREEASVRMREELQLKPGMNVCDMGAGNGYHAIPMAEKVAPDGKVYAVDVQPEMIEMLKGRLVGQKITNIVPIVGLYHDPNLPEKSCDLILLVDVYHEFSHPVHMLVAMRKALKPGGAVVLVEFRAEDDSVPIKPEHKMSKTQINKEMTANGYKLAREFDGLPWQHMMWFEAAEPSATSTTTQPSK